jgi:hypothetical protein
MTNYFALYAVIFMIGFVVVFDGRHQRNRLIRSVHLLTAEELGRLQAIWEACEDA